MQMEEVQKVKRKYLQQLFEKKGVVGVGVGKKIKGGKDTGQLAIIVSVEKKLLEENVDKKDFIHPELDGVPVDVIEVGRQRILEKKED